MVCSRFPALLGIVLSAVVGLAQVRESGRVAARPQAGTVSTAPQSLPVRDSFSTSVTGTRVVLGAGDLLEITVFDTPELAQRTRVGSEGTITMPLIGQMAVRGLVPSELEKMIRTKLIDGHFVKDPQVNVFVAEYAGQTAYVTGEVNRPGAYALLRSHRLRDLIAVAGGLTSRAGNKVTIAHDGEATQGVRIDLSDADDSRSNPEIFPGDNISVDQSGIVYVLGDVERPGGFVLDRRSSLSVIQALALAEGTKSSAALTKARLIRATAQAREEIPLNLKMILQSKSPDVALQPGDIVFVPGSLTRGMGRRTIDTILATASGVAIYARP